MSLRISSAILLLASVAGGSALGQTPIANGGTGATTAPAALANLGAQPLGLGDLRLYGWHGDGRTDDTTAFNAALQALPAAGGEIVIPFSAGGTVLGSSKITVNKPVTIRGEGGGPNGQTTIKAGNLAGTVLDVTSSFVTISDLAFSPASTASKQTGGSYIVVEAMAARFRADRLTLNDFHEGITVTGNTATIDITQLRGLIYSAAGGQATALLHFQGGTDVRVSDVTADGGSQSSPRVKAGIWVENLPGDAVISNANIIGMGTDLLVNPGPGQVVTSLWVADSFLDTATRGALWTTSGGGQIVRSRMSNVWAGSHLQEGIRVEAGVDGLDIDNPHVLLNAGSGIALAGGTNVRVRGGQIAQNGDNGVYVAPGVSFWSVVNATVGATAGLKGNTNYAVYVDVGGSDYFQVQDNNLSGNGPVTAGNGSVFDNSSGIHKTVMGNIGDTLGYAAYRDGPSGFLTFRGNQAGYTGYRFVGPDGAVYAAAGASGLTLGVPLAVTQGGTGGTTAPASRANLGVQQYANVRDYGAVNDCSTDSTAAINAALAIGLPVYLPGSANAAACYLVSGALNAAGPAVTVYGDGDTTRITTNAAGADLFVLGGKDGSTLSAVSIHDLVLGTTAMKGTAVHATGPVTRASLRNIRITANGTTRFDNGILFRDAALKTPGGTFGSIDIGAEIDVAAVGIGVANGAAVHVGTGSKIANCSYGIELQGNVAKTVIDGGTTISSCTFAVEANVTAAPTPNGMLSADASVSVSDAQAAGMNVLTSGLTHLDWSGSVSNTPYCINIYPQPSNDGLLYSVTGARLAFCSQFGIAVSGGFLHVSGTDFFKNGTSGTTNTPPGAIYFVSTAGATIMGNHFEGSGPSGGQGVDFITVPQSSKYIVTNNVLSGIVQNNGTGGIVQSNVSP